MASAVRAEKKIQRIISILTRECLGLRKSHSFLVIADEESKTFADAIWKHALEITPTAYMLLLPKQVKKIDCTSLISRFLQQVDLVLLACKLPTSDIAPLQKAIEQGSRIACLSTLNIDLLNRALIATSSKMEKISQRVADIFSIGRNMELKSENGTALKLSIQRETGIAEIGRLDEKRNFTILPGGRAQIRPKAGSGNGIVIPNGSLEGVGLVKEVNKLQIKQGKLCKILGDDEANKFRAKFKTLPAQAKDIVRIGIGTNHHARLSGNLDEDELAAGIIHLGIGSYEHATSLPLTQDYLRITLKHADLSIDGKLIVKKGKLVV